MQSKFSSRAIHQHKDKSRTYLLSNSKVSDESNGIMVPTRSYRQNDPYTVITTPIQVNSEIYCNSAAKYKNKHRKKKVIISPIKIV